MKLLVARHAKTIYGRRNVPQTARRRPSRRQRRRYCAAPSVTMLSAAKYYKSQHSSTVRFEAEVYVFSNAEGGRHTPFFKGYRPQFYFRTTDVTGAVELPAGVEMVMPGDNIKVVVELICPIAMEDGLRFAIREGVVQWCGCGTKIIE